MEKLLAIICLFFVLVQAKAQDIIVKNDKTEIKAKIEELTETTIKYKKIEMLDGPSYNINKRDVFMIIYKNGTKEYMESTASQPAVAIQETRQPAKSQGRSSNMANSQKNTTTSANDDLIDIQEKKYYYQGELIRSFGQMNTIFKEHDAQESVRYMNKRRTQWIVGASLVGTGLIVYGLSGGFNFSSGAVTNRPLTYASFALSVTGSVFGLMSVSQVKKAVSAYNSTIMNGRRVSFEPTFNTDMQGNHIGIAMKF